MILKSCAVTKARAGRPPSVFTRSVKRASRPMETKARANHSVRRLFNTPPTFLTVSAGIKKEKISEAAINPSTNFGKRSQTTPSPGVSVVLAVVPFLYVHQNALKNDATTIKSYLEYYLL